MIYLLAFVIQWFGKAFFPALLVLVLGAITVGLLWALGLKRKRPALLAAWLAVGISSLGLGCWRTVQIVDDYSHPERRMFREFLARPIPSQVTNLVVAVPSPEIFTDAAIIRFQAPNSVVQGILNHSLPGSTSLSVLAEMKRQSRNPPADQEVISAPDGQSYLPVDASFFPSDGPEAHRWLRERITGESAPGVKTYILLRRGAWGSFQSLVAHNPLTGTVTGVRLPGLGAVPEEQRAGIWQ